MEGVADANLLAFFHTARLIADGHFENRHAEAPQFGRHLGAELEPAAAEVKTLQHVAGGTFLSATLEVRAWGVDNNNDNLLADNVFITTLTPESLVPFNLNQPGLIDLGFSSTFSSSPFLLQGLLLDQMLNLIVDKNGNGRFNPESFSVYYSRLDVTYDTAVPTPEPVSMLLLGSGVATVIARRRKARTV